MFTIALAAAAAAASLGASPALAAPSGETIFQVRVSFADLDVTTHAGAHVLMQRIAKAAAAVCGGGPDSLMHDDRVRFERCRTDAYGRAVKQLQPGIMEAIADYPPRTQLADAN